LYERIQHSLLRFPSTSAYRTGTEALVQQKVEIMNKTDDLGAIEAEIGLGQMEELISQAENELKLIRKLEEDQVI
jgi:NADH dehydrogenase (ubiquinone) 1 alpha subcomplex subunit 5